jgi:hypothetical protein
MDLARQSADELVVFDEHLDQDVSVDLPYQGRVFRYPASFFLAHAADELAEYLLDRTPLEPRGHFARRLDFGAARNASERPVSPVPAERAQLVARC